MSLVEKALQKLQKEREAAAGEVRRDAAAGHSAVTEPTADVVPPQRDLPPAGEPVKRSVPDFGATMPGMPGVPRREIKIDAVALRAAGVLPPDAQERVVGNQFRHIKRPLLAGALGRGGPIVPNGRLIMVGSALQGDGKTFSCLNLACSLALEHDVSVLLVDADVARPQLSRLLGLDNVPGIMDALTDFEMHPLEVVVKTDQPGLEFVPAGRRRDNMAESLASRRLDELLAEWLAVSPNRIVLFDTSPLLVTNEARVLATKVGQVLLVVREDVTPQSAVKDALRFVRTGSSVSLILNDSRAGGASGYYGYSYGD
jgi:exopolysaccharide/PEP-CTERM locus tyrosine autokinase